MGEWVAGRRRQVVAAVLAVLMIGPVAVAAVRVDGFDVTKLNLDDAGIWVVNRTAGQIGRVNTQTWDIEVAVGGLSAKDDIAQLNATVALVDTSKPAAAELDVANVTYSPANPLPAGAELALGGVANPAGVVGAVTAGDGRVWVRPGAQVSGVRPKGDKADLKVGKAAVTAVGVDGRAWVYAPGSSDLKRIHLDADGAASVADVALGDGLASPRITAVGARVALLDQRARRLVTPEGLDVDLARFGQAPVLQQAGGASNRVLVATDEALLSVDLESGRIIPLFEGGTGRAVDPVWLDGCAHGAWNGGRTASVRVCDGGKPEVTPQGQMDRARGGRTMVFRVNRRRVLLNDLLSGANLLFTERDPEVIDDWTKAETKDETKERKEVPKPKEVCDQQPLDPVLTEEVLSVGTRPGRPVIVPVLEHVDVDRCDVVNVAVSRQPAEGEARVVDDGQVLQIAPVGVPAAPIEVTYEVTGRSGRSVPGIVQVDVRPPGSNESPVTKPDETAVVAGRSVLHNVLVNDQDPDGDSLTLLSAVPAQGSDGLVVKTQTNGSIQVTAGSSVSGAKRIDYRIADDSGAGEPMSGVLTVSVGPAAIKAIPIARADRITAVAGRETSFDLLANDSDPNGDKLLLNEVKAPPELGAAPTLAGSPELTFTAAEATTAPLIFPYWISDGTATKRQQGLVRVDVVPAGTNQQPVAVRDDLVVRPGVVGLIDLTANDIDLDGDALAVTSLAPSAGSSKLSVELVDMHIARVTAYGDFTIAETFTYTLSDGRLTHSGTLVIRRIPGDQGDQGPILEPDVVSVRAGATVSVPVLGNDLDPEGEQLTLLPIEEIPADQQLDPDVGYLFVERDEVRLVTRPGADPGTYQALYAAKDPGGATGPETATIAITIREADAQNTRPGDLKLQARVRAGGTTTIPVPLLGIDPDGDPVAIAGSTLPPRLGRLEVTSGGFIYEADEGAAGTDAFRFELVDADGEVGTGSVQIAVVGRAGSNAPPVAVIDRVSVTPGMKRSIPVVGNDSDPNDDTLELDGSPGEGPTEPKWGTVRIEGDHLVYEAREEVDGDLEGEGVADSMSYTITDGRGGRAHGVVAITIRSRIEPLAPEARDDLVEPQAPGGLVPLVDVVGNDFDPDRPGADLTYEILDLDAVRAASGATITPSPKGVRVKVAGGSPRPVTFTYEITDADGQKARAVVSIPVLANLPPVAKEHSVKVKAGSSALVDVMRGAFDPERTKVRLVKADFGVLGTPVPVDGKVRFDATEAGAGSFAYLVEDADGQRTWGRVKVTVLPGAGDETPNDPPTFDSTTVELAAGGESLVRLADLAHDEPGEVLEFDVISGATPEIKVDQSGPGGSVLRVSASDQAANKTASIRVAVKDAVNDPVEATLAVLVRSSDKPVAVAVGEDVSETPQEERVTKDVLRNDVIPPGLQVSILGRPVSSQGSVLVGGDGRTLTFTPRNGYVGPASVSYRIGDDTGDPTRESSAVWPIRVIGRPGRPTAPEGVAEVDRVRLTWQAPDSGGDDITGYVIEANDGSRTVRQRSNLPSHLFTGLETGQKYRFRVIALNKAVTAEAQYRNWSGWSAWVTPDEKPSAPAPPQVRFSEADNRDGQGGVLHVSWTPPDSRGTRTTEYTVTSSSGEARVFTDGRLSERWEGLTNGTQYTFTVKAKNEAGYSDWSGPGGPAVPAGKPGPVPGAVAERDASYADGGWASVSWGQPAANGDQVSQWEVRSVPDRATVSYPGTGTGPASVGGLAVDQTYQFQVRAKNKAGWGDWGAPFGSVMPEGRPGPVTLRSASAGDGQALLSFAEPTRNGANSPVTYKYGDQAGEVGTLSGPGASVTAGGLANDMSHSVWVQACKPVPIGCSARSNTLSVTPFGPPQVAAAGLVGNTTVAWSWPDQPGVQTYTPSLPGGHLTRSGGTARYEKDLGPGESRSEALTVTAAGGGQQQVSAPVPSATTVDTRRIFVSDGGSAAGQQSIVPPYDICTATCRWVNVRMTGFRPNRTYSGECWGSHGGDSPFKPFTVSTDGNGDGLVRPCFYGYAGFVWVRIDGLDSNKMDP